ncbi:MAG TPA: phosphatase PAP2 family protein, partial [Sphingomicrobium sp.]
DPFFSLSGWLKWTLICSGLVLFFHVVKMMRAGVDRPLAVLAEKLRTNKAWLAVIALAMTLGALDLYAFMIVKPQLNVLFPFWADQVLADLDHAIFGIDPWRLFPGWDRPVIGFAYSMGWYLSLLVTFFWLALKPPSQKKSAGLLSYFMIWSLFGPACQALISSAGPIFFSKVGLGDRFAAMPTANVSQFIADYLWTLFETRSLAPGAGISAMPSMHIATVAWLVICLLSYRSKWTLPALGFAFFIYLCSIALGWHYASDGLVGALGAVGCYALSRRYVDWRAARRDVGTMPGDRLAQA